DLLDRASGEEEAQSTGNSQAVAGVEHVQISPNVGDRLRRTLISAATGNGRILPSGRQMFVIVPSLTELIRHRQIYDEPSPPSRRPSRGPSALGTCVAMARARSRCRLASPTLPRRSSETARVSMTSISS